MGVIHRYSFINYSVRVNQAFFGRFDVVKNYTIHRLSMDSGFRSPLLRIEIIYFIFLHHIIFLEMPETLKGY